LVQSSTYHPQTYGQTERVNLILEDMLRACVISSKGSWEKWLPLATVCLNDRLARLNTVYTLHDGTLFLFNHSFSLFNWSFSPFNGLFGLNGD
jgi:hypothetical protein